MLSVIEQDATRPTADIAATLPPPTILDDYTLGRIEHRLRELAATLPLSDDDRDCLRQDMASELLVAAKRFDGSQGDRETFVERVLERFALQAVRTECRRLEHPADCPGAFDDISPGFQPVINDPHQGELDQRGETELCLDLHEIIAELPEDLQEVCRLLMNRSAEDVMAMLGLSEDTFLAQLELIRRHFLDHSIDDTFLMAD